ncbi:MAG: GNAT family N-acetyltransferase [Acidimicrobiales bacterium]
MPTAPVSPTDGGRLANLEVRVLRPDELAAAAAVASRALEDAPPNVASYGDDPLLRLAHVHGLFSDVFANATTAQWGAVAGTCVVGVAGAMPPGACVGFMMKPILADVLSKPVPPLGDPWRASAFWAAWAAHDLPAEHCHIGPVGVEPAYQGMGIGRAVMSQLCAQLDDEGTIGWLETDKERNVRFYQALGFEVVEYLEVLEQPNWFMRRDPLRPAG